MYAQMVKTDGNGIKLSEELTPEERAFQERINADSRIEPKEWMPAGYRASLIRQISQEESFHQRQGFHIMMQMAKGTDTQRRMAQDALNRFWYPVLMMFGPSDADSVHSAQSMAWKIKIDTNDGLRQKFVDQTVPQAEYLGLTVPDDKLAWNADKFGEGKGGYDFSEPDWDEFFAVISGDGPCNAERLGARVKAWEEGAWYREGLMANAAKQADRQPAQAAA